MVDCSCSFFKNSVQLSFIECQSFFVGGGQDGWREGWSDRRWEGGTDGEVKSEQSQNQGPQESK